MLILFLIHFCLNIIILLNFEKIERFVNIYDVPDKKLKLHKKKTPILGGLILLINFLIYFCFQIYLFDQFILTEYSNFKIREILSILILFLSLFFIGLYDDKYKLNPNNKLFFLSVFILFSLLLNKDLIINFISLSFIEKNIFFENFSIFFTLFCILILINSLNFYDGINGQSCINFIIIFSYLFLKSEMNPFYLCSIFFVTFVLYLNIKNKLFLGDSGVFLLGAIVSVSFIYEYNIEKSIIHVDEIFFLLLLPGIDLVRLTFLRAVKGKDAFLGDRNHIHHLLIKKFSLFYTNLILIIISIVPIILFLYTSLNFYIIFLLFLLFYILLIATCRIND